MSETILLRRSLVKTATYRMIIMTLDFITIYIFTRKIQIAVGFMIVSNLYTTIAYFGHERLWASIPWARSSGG